MDNKPIPLLSAPPANPLYQIIDSDRYVSNLEKKLSKLQNKRNSTEPSSKDMIDSLCMVSAAHVDNHVENERTANNLYPESSEIQTSFLEKLLFPEQAVTTDELIAFATRDELAQDTQLNEKTAYDSENIHESSERRTDDGK